ncbi:MAG: mechanosensitive ion channel family protein, partial [Lentisphaeria bacterium]
FILLRKPFIFGERIAIDGNVGDVIDINLLYFTVVEVGGNRVKAEQSTGRIIHIPNSKLLRNSLINYNQGFNYIWHEVCTIITYESDWRLAKNILERIVDEQAGHYPKIATEAVEKATRKYYLKMGKLTPIVYTDTVDNGVRLSIRFLVCPRDVRGVECAIWEKILDEFNNHSDIELAYRTMRIYNPDSTFGGSL